MYLTFSSQGMNTKMNISMRERKEEKQSSNIRLQTQ